MKATVRKLVTMFYDLSLGPVESGSYSTQKEFLGHRTQRIN